MVLALLVKVLTVQDVEHVCVASSSSLLAPIGVARAVDVAVHEHHEVLVLSKHDFAGH